MVSIRIAILDPSGSKKTLVEVPDNVATERLINALTQRMGLPQVGQNGRPITYRMTYTREGEEAELKSDESLAEANIGNDDVLRLYAEMKAGCFLAGTKILLPDGKNVSIENLKVGDRVLSYSFVSDTKKLPADALTNLFKLFNDSVKCVTINSCYSKSQAEAIKTHIPYVIGMKSGIPDNAAIAFSIGFYKAVGAGKGIPFAFQFGVTAIQLEGVSGDDVPILL
ncbi:MAG: hypothetical protein GY801_43805 [bacterium]|nr:hypothetical protein [bacterium]